MDGAQQVGLGPDASRVWALTFEHSPVGMALVRLDGTWSRVNQSLGRILGRTPAELLTTTFRDLTHPDDLAEDLHLWDECLAGVRSDYRLVKRYLHADGRVVWGDLSVALVCDDAGAPLHFVSQLLDVSAHRAAQERLESVMAALEAANADLEQYAAVVSHDLKTPLTAVKASLEMAADQLEGAAPGARALVQHAEAGAERMSTLIDALLAYTTTDPRARGARGTSEGARPVAVLEVVQAALADTTLLLQRAGVRIELDPGLAAAPPVLASSDLVRTLVVNLVGNAVKYRDPARPLTVWVDARRHTPDRLELRVRNDGPPIATADRERVFGLFVRGTDPASAAPASSAAEVAGFGIGLAACRRIVSWHGGEIWIEEPASGGVEFCFTLPVAAP